MVLESSRLFFSKYSSPFYGEWNLRLVRKNYTTPEGGTIKEVYKTKTNWNSEFDKFGQKGCLR